MTPERWEQIKGLFHATLDLEHGQRPAFLGRACADDGILRHEVESLLASHELAESFIEMPASDVAAALLADVHPGLRAGQMVRQFRIAEALAKGGMGEVYLADDTKLGRQVALKLLPPQFTVNADRVRRFEQEARAASALNHPNIVTIHEIGQADSLHFIATEFVDGETLREHMARVPMKLDELLNITIQIASALGAAHAAGIVHRDIKPENAMIRPDGYVKVLDFGLAKLAEPKNKSFLGLKESTQSATGLILGTVNYMSPEQAKGEQVDERTDIFSLGVVIYEMISGTTPFAGDSNSETFANLINAEPQPLSDLAPGVPDELKRIVAKTLRKNKDERYQTTKDLLADFNNLRQNLTWEEKLESLGSPGGQTTSALRPRTGDANRQTAETQKTLSQTISQHKPLAAFAFAALLIGSIVLGYYFFYPRRTALGADGKKSIAVLPLKPINTANRDEIYEIGIADSLILKLSSMKGFKVRSLSATRKYADLGQDPLAAGREQKVDYVLASNYQLAGGRIKVTSQLFNVASGQIEETYKSEKDAADVFAMQDAIAGEVGHKLLTLFAASTSPATKRGTTNEEAYRLYLQGIYLNDKRTLADSRKAAEIFEQAVKLDPNYALAWAGKAHAHRTIANYARSTNIHEEYQKSVAAINKALALDENLADAHSALCENKMHYEWDFAGADRECKRAIELDPNSSLAHQIYSRYLTGRGRHDEAIAEIRTAIDLEPTSLFNQRWYGHSLHFAGRDDEAVVQHKRVISMDPNYGVTYHFLSMTLALQGNYAEAFEWWMKTLALQKADEETVQSYQTAYQTSGWQGVLRERAKRFEKGDEAYYHGATHNALVGNKEKAFEYLEKSYQRHEWWMGYLKVDPRLDSLRRDPRFDELVKRVESR